MRKVGGLAVGAQYPFSFFMVVAILASLLLVGCRPDPPKALDLAGNPVDPFVNRAPVVVLLFVQTDCPISNRYAPTIARLHARFQPQDVAFYLVYPDRREDADAIRRHGREYGLPSQALRDVQHALVKRVGASVTPEAVVLGERGNIVYRGRIDDRYMALDQMRPQPTRNDLANALSAALAGRPPDPSATEAIGCFIADLQ
ncbi:MAG: redoxin domain-containing protein [Gemmatimonadota bacterium]|nr:redoxin domain-containing protein [Gemmatimonadota bacterium]